MGLCAAVFASGCADPARGAAERAGRQGAAPAPPGFLVLYVEHDEPPDCPEPCEDTDPPAGDQSTLIETVRADGSGRRLVGCERGSSCAPGVAQLASAGSPQIAPDGRVIATVGSDGVNDVHLQDLRARVVAGMNVPGSPHSVAWSPDGRRLAVASDRPTGAVYAMRRDGTGQRLVATERLARVSWSRRNVLALSGRLLTLVRPDGREIASQIRHRTFAAVDWSPDGRLLAYGCGNAICALRSDGGGRRVLTRKCGANDLSPLAWSPDGEWVACLRGNLLVAVRLRDSAVAVIRDDLPGDVVYDADWGGS